MTRGVRPRKKSEKHFALLNTVEVAGVEVGEVVREVVRVPTVVIMRVEYANLFFTVSDLYMVFRAVTAAGLSPSDVQVLLLDAHPVGVLDRLWSGVFSGGPVQRLADLAHRSSVRYDTLIWTPSGHTGPLLDCSPHSQLPLAAQFRRHVLSQYNLSAAAARVLDCDRPVVTVLWRRPYASHPRNMAAKISRRVRNEWEVVTALVAALGPHVVVREVQLDAITLGKQLRAVAETDVLVGMHGAGLTHVLFLPPHAAVLELHPARHSTACRFGTLAHWAGVAHSTWQNTHKEREFDTETVVDHNEIVAAVRNLLHKIGCSTHNASSQ